MEVTDWAVFKSFVDDRSSSVQEIPLGNSNYLLQAFDGQASLVYKMADDDLNLSDYTTNYQPSANKNLEHRDSENFQIFAPTYEHNQGLQAVWEGELYTATANTQSIFDKLISQELKAQGGWYELVCDPASPQAVKGDYIEFSIVDKDDTLGLFTALGLTVGTDVLELGKFLRTEYINPWAVNIRQNFLSRGTFEVISGLYFRTCYHSTGTDDVDFKVNFYSHENS